jgi:hypothetical protein
MNLHYSKNAKGNASQDEYFFEGVENQMTTFCTSDDDLENFWLFFCGEL